MTQLFHTQTHGPIIHVCDYKGRTWFRCGDSVAAGDIISMLRGKYTTELEVDTQWRKRKELVEAALKAGVVKVTGRSSGNGFSAQTSGRSTGSQREDVTTDR